MKERLLEFLRAENKTSAQLAEEIAVQPSGISHIISGRNNPSLDFVLKMLEKYPFLSTDWLLFGKGPMYKDLKMQTLFDEELLIDNTEGPSRIKNNVINAKFEFHDLNKKELKTDSALSSPAKIEDNRIKKIVWFYNDHSFEEFTPGK
jgi:transcriptional regulator with XRE-family HTH domain